MDGPRKCLFVPLEYFAVANTKQSWWSSSLDLWSRLVLSGSMRRAFRFLTKASEKEQRYRPSTDSWWETGTGVPRVWPRPTGGGGRCCAQRVSSAVKTLLNSTSSRQRPRHTHTPPPPDTSDAAPATADTTSSRTKKCLKNMTHNGDIIKTQIFNT